MDDLSNLTYFTFLDWPIIEHGTIWHRDIQLLLQWRAINYTTIYDLTTAIFYDINRSYFNKIFDKLHDCVTHRPSTITSPHTLPQKNWNIRLHLFLVARSTQPLPILSCTKLQLLHIFVHFSKIAHSSNTGPYPIILHMESTHLLTTANNILTILNAKKVP